MKGDIVVSIKEDDVVSVEVSVKGITIADKCLLVDAFRKALRMDNSDMHFWFLLLTSGMFDNRSNEMIVDKEALDKLVEEANRRNEG